MHSFFLCSGAAKFMMNATEYKWGIVNARVSLVSHILFIIGTPVQDTGWPAQVRLNQDALTQQFKHYIWGVFKHFCGENLQCSTASNNYCRRAACECDRAAALCFARSRHNPRHKNLDQTRCQKWVHQQNKRENIGFLKKKCFQQNLIQTKFDSIVF